jgi:tetratricopeptide (TPR) repeat protein
VLRASEEEATEASSSPEEAEEGVSAVFSKLPVDPVFKRMRDLMTLFETCFEQLRRDSSCHEVARAMVERIAYVGGWFAPAAIRHSLLAVQGETSIEEAKNRLDEAIDVLVKYNLVIRGDEDALGEDSIHFHPLVHSFGRVKSGNDGGVAMVSALIREGDIARDLEHFQHACDQAIPPRLPPEIRIVDEDELVAWEGIGVCLAYHYLDTIYQIERASSIVEKCKNCFQSQGGAKGTSLEAAMLSCEGRLISERGKYGDAVPLYQRALAILEKAVGPDHSNVATIVDNIAGLLQSQGTFEDALPLYQRALAIRRKARGPDHSNTATSVNNMAGLLQSQINTRTRCSCTKGPWPFGRRR